MVSALVNSAAVGAWILRICRRMLKNPSAMITASPITISSGKTPAWTEFGSSCSTDMASCYPRHPVANTLNDRRGCAKGQIEYAQVAGPSAAPPSPAKRSVSGRVAGTVLRTS